MPPQLVVPGRMLHVGWVPADPDAVAAMVPPGLTPDGTVVMTQHAGTGPGAAPAGGRPRTQIGAGVHDGTGPWWLQHVADHPGAREHALSRGVPSRPGITTIDVADGVLTGTTWCEGSPVARVRVRLGAPGRPRTADDVAVARPVEPWEVLSLEFPGMDGPLGALRPAEPLQVIGAWCAPTGARAGAPSGRLRGGRIQPTRGTHGTG
ncbi:MAG: hypothetical protein AB7V62_11770 [Thermoleophilia bacterium]